MYIITSSLGAKDRDLYEQSQSMPVIYIITTLIFDSSADRSCDNPQEVSNALPQRVRDRHVFLQLYESG